MEQVKVSFLNGRNKGSKCVTWGIPWKEGEMTAPEGLVLCDGEGGTLPMQSKANAYWPDGSVKWTLHSANANNFAGDGFVVSAGKSDLGSGMCTETRESITVDTGVIKAVFARTGGKVIQEIKTNGIITCSGAELVCVIENRQGNATAGITKTEHTYIGDISETEIEENGAVRSVIKVSGTHVSTQAGHGLFPFTLRFYFYSNSEEIKIVHTFIYDADVEIDFMKGLGIRFMLPMTDRNYNRHVKIAGDDGFLHEGLQMLTSWRPSIAPEVYERQLNGELIDFDYVGADDEKNLIAVKDIAIWDNFKIYQDSSEHFVIKKRTRSEACAYIDAVHGGRAKGLAYLGCYRNGLAVGLRDFWQKHPSVLAINGAAGDNATITAWLWPPEAEAADMRHYDVFAHAGASYEGFDEIRSTPYGIANTNEIYIWGFTGGIATNEALSGCIETISNPPVITCTPEYMHSVRAFGTWSLIDRGTEKGQWLEEQLDKAIEYYQIEIDQRKWYGFFHYGDFMHTYDNKRHSWKYDTGGYAWQNTELVPTLWLWLAFLRSGRADIYRLAEAMTRHTSEVDSYHIGQYKGLGSRHNVIHWGCACKEARVAMAGHHRYYYYITGDERMGDIFEDVKDAEYGVERLDPLRFFYNDGLKTHARTGPDWSSLCANWMTAWERHNDEGCKNKLLTGIECIKSAPLQLISGSDFGFDPDTGEMIYIGESAAGGSHLAICMGGPSVWMELADSLKDSAWDKMLADYGEFYLLPSVEKEKRSNGTVSGSGWSFPYMASAMMAYYAKYSGDKERAAKIWEILTEDWTKFHFQVKPVVGFATRFVQSEVHGITTNFIAQWCLNVIMCKDLIGDRL